MKTLLFTFLTGIAISAFAQSESNFKALQFANAENPIGLSFWQKGDNLTINLKSSHEGFTNYMAPINAIQYSLSYELSQGDGQNLWFLIITCKDDKGCIFPTGENSIKLAISEHKEHANNILTSLQNLQ